MRNISLYDSDPKNTHPILLIDFGTEKFSTLTDYGDYVAGVVSLTASKEWRQVTVSLPATQQRIEDGLLGLWRNIPVKVTHVPAVEYPRVVADGYFTDEYANSGIVEGDPVTLFQGTVDSGGFGSGNRVKYEARHDLLSNASVPGLKYGPPINYHCPSSGTVIQFKNTVYTLE